MFRKPMSWKHAVAAVLAGLSVGVAHAQTALPPATDWATLGRFLSLVQVFMQAASTPCPPGAPAAGCDASASQRAFDDIVGGRNPQANAVMLEIFGDVPQPEREKMLAIGRSMAAMNRKQMAADAQGADDTAAIRARKDLAGMGLGYHDRNQFLDAVKRKDAIAVRLFLIGRGVDPNATDAWGTSALELARRGGDPEIISLLSGSLPRP